MKRIGFSYIGFAFLLLLFIPDILWASRMPIAGMTMILYCIYRNAYDPHFRAKL